MSSDHIKQHYVPKSYLKRFAVPNTNNNGFHIGVRLKTTNDVKLFIKSIDDVAYEKNYYDISNRKEPKHWELYFANSIEPLYGKTLNNLITRITMTHHKQFLLMDSEKESLSTMICFQLMRVPAFLNPHIEVGKKASCVIKDQVLQLLNPYLSELQVKRINDYVQNKGFVKDIVLKGISDSQRLENYSKELLQRIWIVEYNTTELPFFTSDNPVIMFNYLKGSYSYSDTGLARADTIIFFPLSPKIMIQLVPSIMVLGHGTDLDGICIPITKEDTKFIITSNYMQMDHCSSETYMHPDFLEVINRYSLD